jgi:hypothetical protein
MKTPTVPKINTKNKTAEQVKAISETLKESYAKGRRFRRTGFPKTAPAK